MSRPAKPAALMIVGGTEAPAEAPDVLGRFVALCGGPDARIVVLTAASTVPDEVWRAYQGAFAAAGARRCEPLHVRERSDATHAASLAAMREARGIYIAGGDQKRLVAVLGGTALHQAMRTAVRDGACIAGTSAGASALGVHMVTDGRAEFSPEKGAVGMGAGLGFLAHCIIDQHFSQRHRINRLLTLIAANPELAGIGVDEDTALVLAPDGAIEVVGSGAVTLVDGRHMRSNLAVVEQGEIPLMLDVRVHVLPSGTVLDTLPDVLRPMLQPVLAALSH
ncbi:cyanophycinase [Massilia sp. YMA4]|uniref:cyanophycinase n=1 Tax=Massilia sp. YMA4 TaxID=1593482 RepID=UPI001D0BF785|nr:cyanophycinase [Massilia sp. YMA4]